MAPARPIRLMKSSRFTQWPAFVLSFADGKVAADVDSPVLGLKESSLRGGPIALASVLREGAPLKLPIQCAPQYVQSATGPRWHSSVRKHWILP